MSAMKHFLEILQDAFCVDSITDLSETQYDAGKLALMLMGNDFSGILEDSELRDILGELAYELYYMLSPIQISKLWEILEAETARAKKNMDLDKGGDK